MAQQNANNRLDDYNTFSNLILKDASRHPKNGKKKGGFKAQTMVCRRTSASAQRPILALDRAYINYAKLGISSELAIYI